MEHSDRSSDRAADSRANQRTFATVAQPANYGAGARRSAHRRGFFAGLAVRTDRTLLVFYRRLIHARSILHRSRQKHGVAAGIDQSGKVHENFGAPLDVSSTLDVADSPLHVRAGRNEHSAVNHNRKRSLRVDPIAFMRSLARNRMFQLNRNFGSGG